MWGLFLYCLFLYIVAGLGVSVAYHRLLTHRCAEALLWFEKLLVLLGLPAGTPVQWVGNHRQHHRYTDKSGDPHSPCLEGFWYAHCGWYIQQRNPVICLLYAIAGPGRMLWDSVWRPRTNQQYNHLATDIQEDSFYRFLSTPLPYTLLVWLYLAAILFPAVYYRGWSGFVAVWSTLIVLYNAGDAVNSLGHYEYGKSKSPQKSKNNAWLAWLSFGEGWHAYHHQKPRQANFGHQKGEVDFGYIALRFFRFLGLVRKI